MFKVKKFVDLSWELAAGTPIYPGDPEPSISIATTLENEGYNLFQVIIGTQTGTHVDAPYHFLNNGTTVDNMDLSFFFGEAVVIRVTNKQQEEQITMADVEPYAPKIKPGTIVLFNTNWYKKRGSEEFFRHPYVAEEVAHWLVNKGVRFICSDTINVDRTGGTEFPVHDLFAAKNLMIGENMAYFDKIDFDDNLVLAAFPLKISGADGSPVRAVAMQLEMSR